MFIENIEDSRISKAQMKVKILHKGILFRFRGKELLWVDKVHLLTLIEFVLELFLKKCKNNLAVRNFKIFSSKFSIYIYSIFYL